jgi:hypothetical protein
MNEYPKYILDKPKGIDKFDGGSQKLLSKAIAEYILKNDNLPKEESMPRIIGIEGTWGSGKSNVVKMVENYLKSGDYLFFEYDAWGHQEDLQRRSFLETLTEELLEKGYLPRNKKCTPSYVDNKQVTWNEKLIELLAHRRITDHKSIPVFNGGTILALICFLLIPSLSNYIISSSIADSWSFMGKLFCLISPVVCLFLIWGIIAIIDKEARHWGWILQISKSEATKTRNYETINEDEPTVSKFSKWMNDLNDFIDKFKSKKLIVVYDNMDRLPANKVKELWSSIHSFFAEEGFKNIWVIVPYDENHLSCAFSADEQIAKKLTKFFIDKTFPVTFNVPKPVITDYKGIFSKLYKEAFSNSQIKDEEIINRIYRLLNPQANIREIIIFINSLVSLLNSRKDTLSLISMAIYQLKKEKILEDPVKQILSGEYLSEISNIIPNDDLLKAEIAAITYGVDINNAKQIPLTEYINNCINRLAGYDINIYSESDSNFDSILKEVCENIDIAKIDSVIEMLNALNKNNENIAEIWEELTIQQMKLPLKTSELSQSIQILLHHVSKETKVEIVNKLCDNWINAKDFNGSKYVECINNLTDICGNDCDIPKPTKMVSAEIFIDMVKEAKDKFKYYNLQTEPNKLDEFLAEKLPNNFDYYEIVSVLYSANFSKFEILRQGIEETINNDKIEVNNIGQIFNTYRKLSKQGEVLPFVLPKNKVDNLLSELITSNKCTILDGYIDMLSASIANGTNVEIEDKYISDVAQIIDYYIDFDDLLINGLTQNYTGQMAIAKYMIKNKLGIKMDLTAILPNYIAIRNHYSVFDEELLQNLDQWKIDFTSSDEIITASHLQQLIPSDLYAATSKIKNELTKSINNFAIQVLSKLTTDQLRVAINSNDYWNQLMANFVENKVLSSLPDNINNLVGEIYKDIPNGSRAYPINSLSKELISKVNLSKIAHVFLDIRDKYCNSVSTITSNNFILLENGLRLHGNLIDRAEDVTNKILKPVITDINCKSLILGNAYFYKKLLSKTVNIDDFRSKIEKSWEEIELQQIIENIK